MDEQIVIARRFRGPPRSGNGGYTCGAIAHYVSAPAVEVVLRAPPPLEVPLAVAHEGELVHVTDPRSGQAIADARPATLALEAPPRPDEVEIRAAEARYAGAHEHVFAECFVCGPARAPGDGLRIFAGRVADGSGLVASRWSPDASLAQDGLVLAEHVWAALDCPGFFASGFAEEKRAAVLARMTAEVARRPRAGDALVCLGWPIMTEGRKRRVGTAVLDAKGDVIARAEGLWVELDERAARAFLATA